MRLKREKKKAALAKAADDLANGRGKMTDACIQRIFGMSTAELKKLGDNRKKLRPMCQERVWYNDANACILPASAEVNDVGTASDGKVYFHIGALLNCLVRVFTCIILVHRNPTSG